jgi:hypothetical protein
MGYHVHISSDTRRVGLNLGEAQAKVGVPTCAENGGLTEAVAANHPNGAAAAVVKFCVAAAFIQAFHKEEFVRHLHGNAVFSAHWNEMTVGADEIRIEGPVGKVGDAAYAEGFALGQV